VRRKEYRTSRTAFDLVRASVALCREKGYRRIYGHAREDYLPFWQHFGFKLKENGAPFAFSDQVFVEMVDDIDPSPTALSLKDDPYRLIRPEGAWHQPGRLKPRPRANPICTQRGPVKEASMTSDAGSYAWIIRTLVTCREEADRMQLNDLSRLINMAVLQTALDWEGEEPSQSVNNTNLEALLRLKMKLAFSERSDNVFVLNSKTAGEA
jgi:hypothetical protein